MEVPWEKYDSEASLEVEEEVASLEAIIEIDELKQDARIANLQAQLLEKVEQTIAILEKKTELNASLPHDAEENVFLCPDPDDGSSLMH